ncbi:helix-turn-helix domain-containing protein [Pseudonocardia halophobica]|uniref:helix-turn-helix domain-containing protein n=1 Tax=Pseudonocardia halophobica TaxID=29401 RepID=UPI003D8A8D0B
MILSVRLFTTGGKAEKRPRFACDAPKRVAMSKKCINNGAVDTFGMRMRNMRVALGLPQSVIAERIERPRQSVSVIERSLIPPRPYIQQLIADALGCTVDDLLPDPRNATRETAGAR